MSFFENKYLHYEKKPSRNGKAFCFLRYIDHIDYDDAHI